MIAQTTVISIAALLAAMAGCGNANTGGDAGTVVNAGTAGTAGTTAGANTTGDAGTTAGANTTGGAAIIGGGGTTGGDRTTGSDGTAGRSGINGAAGTGGGKAEGGAGGVAGGSGGAGGLGIWVRILPFGLRDKGWQLDDYNGQDVVDQIAELNPNVLSRFITGKPDLNWTVPMGPGQTAMRFADYLNTAMAACQPKCSLTPRVTLDDLWSEDYRYQSSKALYDLPVSPRVQVLDLDTYFTGGTDEDHKRALQKYKDIGYTDLVFNFAGGTKDAFGLVSYAMAGINGTSGQVAVNNIDKMDGLGIAGHLAHIDYGGPIEEFALLTPDEQATIIQKISRQQHQDHFTFIYPVLYGTQGYYSTKVVTDRNGPFKGATIFQVIKQMILCDRKYPQPCTPQF